MRNANFEVVFRESSPDTLVVRDLGPWSEHRTITNDAERVVEELAEYLPDGRRLFYYDSQNQRDEIIVSHGRFVGFIPGENK